MEIIDAVIQKAKAKGWDVTYRQYTDYEHMAIMRGPNNRFVAVNARSEKILVDDINEYLEEPSHETPD